MISEEQIFRSKKGWVIYAPFVICSGVFVLSVFAGNYLPAIVCVVVISVATLPMLLNTQYLINADNTLKIRCGFFVNKNIDIKEIKKIEHTRSPLSAPALSLDRLEIFYNKFDTVMISPENKDDFISLLKNINPAIEVK